MFLSWPELHLGYILPKRWVHRRVHVGMTTFDGLDGSSFVLKRVAVNLQRTFLIFLFLN